MEYRKLKYAENTNHTYFQVDHRYVHVDNEGLLVPVPSMIMEELSTHYEFDEMELTGHSRLVFYHPQNSNVTAVVHRFIGDKTGRLHMRDRQKLYCEVVESTRNVTEAPCSYIIDYGAEIILPTEVHLHGTNTDLYGLMSGVHHLYILDGAHVTIYSTAQTALIENRQYTHVSEKGNISLPTINIYREGFLSFSKIATDITVTAAFLEIKYEGTVMMNHGFIDVGELDVEAESHITLDGTGYEPNEGPGAGSDMVGGSYGGIGGGSDLGMAYGSVFNPSHLGSGGGGAAGGGYVSVKVGRTFHLNGLLSTRGAVATGSTGGGSGGAIYITAFNMSGHGVIDASGGSGYNGGGGGRIALHITFDNRFGGEYVAAGGLGSSGATLLEGLSVGGPGTVYKYESNRGPQYRELKYNPLLNATAIKPEHSKLLVDNKHLDTDNPAMVMKSSSLYFEFDEVQVEGYSYVEFYHPISNEAVNIVIHELSGNKKGLLRVRSHQRLVVHFVESTHTYLDAPCGFHVDDGGEAVLPTTLIVTSEAAIFAGRLTGVEEIIIERDGEIIFQERSHTHDVPHTEWYIADPSQAFTPGVISFQKITVNNQGTLSLDNNPHTSTLIPADLYVYSGGVVNCKSLRNNIEASNVTVQKTGLITGMGYGYMSSEGPGAGKAHASNAGGGGGGGHASYGKSIYLVMILYLSACN